jgi:ATP phosphoribosyltransferase regulatory subunit
LLALSGLKADLDVRKGSIFAVESDDPQFWELVQELREQGERVICGLEAQPAPPDCDRMLMQLDGSWQVRAIS